MDSSRDIDINKSSLASLKAELIRKQEEVKRAKLDSGLTNVQSIPKVVKKSKWELQNKGIEKRNQKDAEEIREQLNEEKKSERALQLKAQLYDKLSKNPQAGSSDGSVYLVDFNQKATVESSNQRNEKVEEDEIIQHEASDSEYLDSEDEWIDFVDFLGRTKRCLRKDLQLMKEQDKRASQRVFNKKDEGESSCSDSNSSVQNLVRVRTDKGDIVGVVVDNTSEQDLLSADMKKEILRQKWEEQERLLLQKSDVHYQDVLFDEARSHGVAYYEFSKDEAERRRQQEELQKLRKETEEQQTSVQQAKEKRDQQMKARLKAARRRKRERLGLPPEEEEEEEEREKLPDTEEKDKEIEEKAEVVQKPTIVKKPATIREWDIGKNIESDAMSQEEWNEKKRSERPQEFAPPAEYGVSHKIIKRQNIPAKREPPPQYVHDLSKESRQMRYRNTEMIGEECDKPGRRGVEIPPPATFEMYGPSSSHKQKTTQLNKDEMEKSIEAGLQYIRKQVDERRSQKEKGMLDLI